MKIVIIEPLGITPEKLAEATAAVKARGHEIVAYSTKEEDPDGLVSGLSEYVLSEDGSTAVYKVKIEKPGFYNIYFYENGDLVSMKSNLEISTSGQEISIQ